jgi:hypothetical protein
MSSVTDFKGPAAWSTYLKNNYYASGKSSKVPKKGTDEYDELKSKYLNWQQEGLSGLEAKGIKIPVKAVKQTKSKKAAEVESKAVEEVKAVKAEEEQPKRGKRAVKAKGPVQPIVVEPVQPIVPPPKPKAARKPRKKADPLAEEPASLVEQEE